MRFRADGRKLWLLGFLLILAVLVCTGCSEKYPQTSLSPVGKTAKEADSLWNLVFGIAVVIFFLVEGALVYALVRFRERPDRQPAQFHGNTKVEVILTIIPALILAGVGVPTVKTIFDIARRPTGSHVINVTVTGHQFWWQFDYPQQHITTANELHMPTGTPVYLSLESADVIHSFWVPKLSGTQDLVPGNLNHLTFETNTPGVYLGQCKEFCGLSHANMRIRVFVQTPAHYQTWVASQQQPAQVSSLSGDAAAGKGLFLHGASNGAFPGGPACSGCHAVAGTTAQGIVGPNLTHFASRRRFAGEVYSNDTQNLTNWLADPPGMKPGVDMPKLGLTATQIKQLVAFLQSLK
ncbi:MAG: cytochrome c oxidase subunit II [Actinomycetota bacterium]|nr:cytochrome c oxidase subunit II [Actinomycetota bacterium]